MTAFFPISQVKLDGYDQLLRELRIEFDYGDVGGMADRIVEAEAADFYWEARVLERYLGHYFDAEVAAEEPNEELVRVVFLSLFGRRWHAGTCVVDGEGNAASLLWLRSFDGKEEAEAEFFAAR